MPINCRRSSHARHVLGNLKPEVAAELGLPAEIKVVAGAIDTTAAAIGAGAIEDYLPHLYIGTSSWMAAHVPFKKTDIVSSLASVPCAVPGRYLLTALQATAGGNLTYLRDNILYHKDELLQEADVPDIFKVLDRSPHACRPGQTVSSTPPGSGANAPRSMTALCAPGLYNLSLEQHPRGYHPRLPGRDRLQHAAGCWPRWRNSWGAEAPPSTSSAAGRSRTSGARSSPMC